MLCTAAGVHAANIDMYINGNYVVRDLETVGEFDMLPILDIANELGYQCSFDGIEATLNNDQQQYTFVLGKPAVLETGINRYAKRYGLDVVPKMINEKFYIPAKFLQDIGLTYTWDNVTSTLFINSDYTYQWLIGTAEYQNAKGIKQTYDAIQGWWLYYNYEELYYNCMGYFYENMCFSPDGTFYLRTFRTERYGTYSVIDPNTVKVYYDDYYSGPVRYNDNGNGSFTYRGSGTSIYQFVGSNLIGESAWLDKYVYF